MTKQPYNCDGSKLLIFDGHALAFHSWFTSEPTRALPGFFRMVNYAVERHGPTHVIVTFDPPPPTFRHKLFEDYKAHRPPVPVGLLEDCERVCKRVDEMGVIYCSAKGYEADDVIGTLATKADKYKFSTVIVTSDLDLLQLVTSNTEVEVFSQYRDRRHFDEESARRRFDGLSPKNIPDYKALVGDPSDNLPGVPGIGAVSAEAILGRYSSLDKVYENLDAISQMPIRGAKRLSQILKENREQAFLMRTLTTVVIDVPIEIDIGAATIEKTGLQTVIA